MSEKCERPWGCFEILYEEKHLKTKRIRVKPGMRLSLQSHSQRAENWVILAGRGIVTVEAGRIQVFPNQSVFIPCGARHRIENTGKDELIVVEVQTGSYLGEDDIVRYEDDFNRA